MAVPDPAKLKAGKVYNNPKVEECRQVDRIHKPGLLGWSTEQIGDDRRR